MLCAQAWTKSLQSCPTLCDPINNSPPGSPIPGIFQARVLEWGAIAFSVICLLLLSRFSRVRLSVTPWTVARQGPLSMGFSILLQKQDTSFSLQVD